MSLAARRVGIVVIGKLASEYARAAESVRLSNFMIAPIVDVLRFG